MIRRADVRGHPIWRAIAPPTLLIKLALNLSAWVTDGRMDGSAAAA